MTEVASWNILCKNKLLNLILIFYLFIYLFWKFGFFFFFFFEKHPPRGNDFINAFLKDQVDKHQEHLEEQTPSKQEKDYW